MNWLRRSEPSPAEAAVALAVGPAERATPGVAALLEGVEPDRSHSVLDLATAANPALQVYSRFARWVKFAGVLNGANRQGCSDIDLGERPDHPYDLVFAWDILDRVFPEERSSLIRRLAELSAPGARLHVLVDASQDRNFQPYRFTLLAADRMQLEPFGPPRPARRRMLPAEVERLLSPFQVMRGFTLREGLREYVAVRQP